MKILIDMSNSPHVVFFDPIIKELEKKGHKVKIIARRHAQTIDLLDLYGLKYKLIGKHAGKNKFKKLLNAFFRVIEIRKYISKEKPDICLSHQSPYIIYAGFLKCKKRIYIFDNEHAKFQNLLTFPLASKIICPEAIEIKGKKVVKYPGVKEAIYLKEFKINNKDIEKIDKIKNKKIFVRTEITSAAYHSGDSIFNLVRELSKKYQIIVSPRNEEQIKEYKKLKGIIVLEKPVHAPSLIKKMDLVMSGGGTVNREAAVLGKPVVSLYSGELLEVDKYLIENGLMIHDKNPSLDLIEGIIEDKKENLEGKEKIDFKIIGRQAIDKIIKAIGY